MVGGACLLDYQVGSVDTHNRSHGNDACRRRYQMLEAKRFVGDVVKERNERWQDGRCLLSETRTGFAWETWWRRKGDDERGAAADEDGHVDCGGPALVEGN